MDNQLQFWQCLAKKKLSHIEFEILSIFCEELSKELTGFFEAKDFLIE